jgi:arylsulfatase A-like enzyme
MLDAMPKPTKPNILYIFADQWRAQAFGYAGDPNARTPRIDALARESVDVRQAVAGTPVCCPIRASLLTGLYPDRHGIFLNDAPLDPGIPSLGKSFSAAGYATAWIGKWHLDGHGRSNYIPPERRQGFKYWKTLECTHDYHASKYYEGDSPEQKQWEGYDAIAQTDDAIALIERQRGEQPFLIVLSWGPPHDPYQTAPAEYRRRFDDDAMRLRPNVPEKEGFFARVRNDLAGYCAHGAALDDCVGRLLDALERTGLADDTIVIFSSDHGDMIGSQGLHCKQCPWEESVRVPFLLRWRNGLGRQGRTSDAIVDAVDVFPTLCGLTGVAAPGGLQGRDLSQHLRDGTVPSDNAALYAQYQTFGTWLGWNREAPPLTRAREGRGILTGRYTYVEDRDGPWMLYDNAEDPYQQRNLVGLPAHAALQRELKQRLQARLAANGDAFPSGQELVRRWGYEADPNGTIPYWKLDGPNPRNLQHLPAAARANRA